MPSDSLCVVCGKPMVMQPHRYKARPHHSTCGDPHCLAVLFFTPSLKRPMPGYPVVKHTDPPTPRIVLPSPPPLTDPEVIQQVAERYKVPSADWAFGDEYLSADLRGLTNAGARDVWGHLGQVPVMFRRRARAGSLSFHIIRRADESTATAVRRQWTGSTENRDRDYGMFLAWRCRCILQTTYTVQHISDLPDEPGPHGNCLNCGATPLYVEVEAE